MLNLSRKETKNKIINNFVIVILQGGLGNQLFQYSFGKYLEKRFNCKVIFDTRYFKIIDKNNKWQEKFRLNFFNIDIKLFSHNTSKIHFKYFTRLRYLFGNIYYLNFLNFFLNKKSEKIFIDLSPENYSDFIKKFDVNSIYIGHWETKYFVDEIIKKNKKDFDQKGKIYKKLKTFINKINNKQVMIHFSDTSHWTDYEKIDKKFYLNAIREIRKLLGYKLEFHIYSKNLDYAKQMSKQIFTKNDKLIFIGEKKLNDYEEFYLMRKYKNFIIPNSTFSWWAAYLSEKKGKLIIIPKKWYSKTVTIKNKITRNMIRV